MEEREKQEKTRLFLLVSLFEKQWKLREAEGGEGGERQADEEKEQKEGRLARREPLLVTAIA